MLTFFDLPPTEQRLSHNTNKKQCSRQLQCEVPCSIGNVVNSSLFINSSLSSLPSTCHAACCPWEGGGSGQGGLAGKGGRGHFSPAAIYCIATWCFIPKGLRTICLQLARTIVSECLLKHPGDVAKPKLTRSGSPREEVQDPRSCRQ